MKTRWVKPTLETRFHIDRDWWEEKGRNFRVHLLSHLCSECQERYKDYHETELIDWIDAATGEVAQVDGLWHSLRVCCSQKSEYVNEQTPLTTAIFRVFLANGNEPLTPVELGKQLNRPADTILRTIGGLQVYHGIKPVSEEEQRRALRRKVASSEE
jgi:hypothetical protein